ncbi:hypothetical protein AWM68_00480 [Fictibacillus phosphorivorans]|uniref:Uncharacterized protein n=1 Tax=Fictibacillus phosphorivorans TaxID=1221500 RepID=A0A161TR42_9BACL|nr:hypothetical protein [Fictibacillus phosphorivorans]KZE68791.1 hypothetical protein AWM68_00480 [Fictibacillus phosphorivorans]
MQLESLLSWGISLVFILLLVLVYKKKGDREERFLGWKLVGYYFLGTFTLRLESWILPVGIAVFLLFFLPKIISNKQSKKWAASLGLLSFALSIVISHSVEAYYEGMIQLKPSSDNAYEMNFLKEYEKVKAALDADGELAINNMELSFEKDGKMKQFNYEIYYSRDDRNMSAWITLLNDKYQVVTHIQKDEEEMMMNHQNYISSPTIYFQALDLHGLKKMLPTGDLYYVYFTNSDEASLDVEDASFWTIERSGIQKHTEAASTDENTDSEEAMVPQFSYQIRINSMSAMGAGDYKGDQQRYFAISPELYN